MSYPTQQDVASRGEAQLLQDALGESDPMLLLELVRSMEAQLSQLYGGDIAPRGTETPATLPAVYTAVGVESADEFVELVRSMEEQLAAFYDAD
ncbi:MAG: hypothetical protein AAFN13_18480 [Bacteroidota bacterium]